MIALFLLFLFSVACQSSTIESETNEGVEDTQNIETVEEITSDMKVIHYRADTMDRGNHEYVDREVVIDTHYYSKNDFKRGDVVAVETESNESDHTLLRIIGLPGEKLNIEKGQVYINGEAVEEFYGRYHHAGMDLSAYQKLLENENFEKEHVKQNVINQIEIIENQSNKKISIS